MLLLKLVRMSTHKTRLVHFCCERYTLGLIPRTHPCISVGLFVALYGSTTWSRSCRRCAFKSWGKYAHAHLGKCFTHVCSGCVCQLISWGGESRFMRNTFIAIDPFHRDASSCRGIEPLLAKHGSLPIQAPRQSTKTSDCRIG